MSQQQQEASPPNPATEALRSVHTASLPQVLEQLGISLVVSTYQAGRVILVRKDGEGVNTHFRGYERPMGIASDGTRLAIGSQKTVWTLRNMPAVARKLAPVGKHDACYLPRSIHVTGDVDIHEMAYDAEDELWIVNTRFGCLCTLDAEHSFTPRWRPPFVSAYAPEDRCHLNGLAMLDGRPKYVTALGETDTAGGWRANKPSGGILMDVDTDEILLRGLSMPHSPRWHQGKLWLLESGRGTLAVVDLEKKTWIDIARVPGFTRGLDFVGPIAFIGLSQVRESAVFSGIPLVEEGGERACGVWVVDTRTGQTLAFLRFESGVREIFAVAALQGQRFPEMLEWDDPRLHNSYVLPDEALKDVPAERLEPGADGRRQTQPEMGRGDPFVAAYNRGIALRDQGRVREAKVAFQTATELKPDDADAWNDLANAHQALDDVDTALDCYEKAVTLRPDFAVAHMNLGMTLLKTGDYTRGFAEFGWRWDTPSFLPLSCPQPQWEGEDLHGKRILVHTEQGAGDAIQFLRFLPLVAERAERVILVAPQPLLRLFSHAEGIDELRPPGDIPLDAFDTYAPLMSLPGHLGITLDNLPADIPYLAPPLDRLPLPSPAPDRPLKVGLVWGGSPTQGDDANRSAPVAAFRPLLDLPGVTYYSLQVGPRAHEVSALRGGPAPVLEVKDLIGDWLDSTGYVAQLDLMLGVDTGIMHLTGALGIPAWVLLGQVADWRWMRERDDSPWYPSLRLFRQRQRGDWAELIARVGTELEATAKLAS